MQWRIQELTEVECKRVVWALAPQVYLELVMITNRVSYLVFKVKY